MLGKWALKENRYGADFNAIMFRRTTVSSEDAIDRSKQIFGPLGGKFNETKLIWRMPNGGRVAFAYLDSVSDAQEYQGRNVTDVWIEEAGQYPDSVAVDRLFGVMRSAAGVPVQMILTANPGGPGQLWLRDRYGLHPFPRKPKVIGRTLENGALHQAAVIPSRITDNRILLDSDPTYIDRLHMVGSAELVRAWLEGDWSAIEGAFFAEWNEAKHVVPHFDVPKDWLRFRSMDWGFAKPFSVGWWAVVGDEFQPPSGMAGARTGSLPRGALVRYREWYGCEPGKPNAGLRLTAKEVAQGIKAAEAGEDISYGVLDPAAFSQDGGPSHAEAMMAEGVIFRRADNRRVPQAGAMGGWNQFRQRLRGDEDGPMLYVMDTCRDFIRTVPVLQHDAKRAEDLDTEGEDHIADEARYGCMSRPYVPTPADKPKPSYPVVGLSAGAMKTTLTFQQLRDRNKKLRAGK